MSESRFANTAGIGQQILWRLKGLAIVMFDLAMNLILHR